MNIYIQDMPRPQCNQYLKRCHNNALMHSFCIAALHVTVNNAFMVVLSLATIKHTEVFI